ncbi:MAG TPA: SRPBCC family protein [Saprospiraceae bacterium]|nr:SRPBCC family protein [Saprospiraceae bacterium]
MPTINLTTHIKAPISQVFDLSRSVDLHKLSTKHTNEEAIAGVTSGLMQLNDTVTWRAKHLGVYQILTTKITQYDDPNSFTDEMVNGIFKSFKHKHLFVGDGEMTMMTDIFFYQSPLGFLGKIADVLFLKKYMTDFLIKRNEVIRKVAES